MDGVTVSRMKKSRKHRKQRSMTEPVNKNRSQRFQFAPSTHIERCLISQRNGFIRMNKKYEIQNHNTNSTTTLTQNQNKWAFRTVSRIKSYPIEISRSNLNRTEQRQIKDKQAMISPNKTDKISASGGKSQVVVNPNISSADSQFERGFFAVPYQRQHFKSEESEKLYEDNHFNSSKHLAKKANQMGNFADYVASNRAEHKTNHNTLQPNRLPPLPPRKNWPKSKYPESKNTSLSASTFIDSSQKQQKRANAMVTPFVTQKSLKASSDTNFITGDLDREINYMPIGKLTKSLQITTKLQELDVMIYSEKPFNETTNQETISNRNLLGSVIVEDNNKISAQNKVHPPKERYDQEGNNVMQPSVIKNRRSEEKQSIRLKNYKTVLCDTDGSNVLVRRPAVCENADFGFRKKTKMRTEKRFVSSEGQLEPIQGNANPDTTNNFYCKQALRRTGVCDNTNEALVNKKNTRALQKHFKHGKIPREPFIDNENPDQTNSLQGVRSKDFPEELLIPPKVYKNAPSYNDLDVIADSLNKVQICNTNHTLVASRRRAAVCDSNDSAFRERVKTKVSGKRFQLSTEGSIEAFPGNKDENTPQKRNFNSTTQLRRVGVCDNTDEVLYGRIKLRTMKKRFGQTGEVGKEEKALLTTKFEIH